MRFKNIILKLKKEHKCYIIFFMLFNLQNAKLKYNISFDFAWKGEREWKNERFSV